MEGTNGQGKTAAPLLELSGIHKSFPGVRALENVSFRLMPGTVHVICGENGAGKSTLVKIVNGVYQPDRGEIKLNGVPVRIGSPLEAREHKISMIFQELNYIPENTIEQHLFLGVEPLKKFGNIDWKTIRRKTLELFEREHLSYSPVTKLKNLTISDIQMIEILKAVSFESSVIIMDEPTSAITENEVKVLFEKIKKLVERGVGIIYISHKLDEIFQIADDISILRDGSLIETRPADRFDVETVISLMVGRKMDQLFPGKHTNRKGAKILEVENLTMPGKFNDVSFHVARGEVVGMAGLMGAGRTEVARALFGLDPYVSGNIKIHGKAVHVRDVADSISNSMVMLSEDRKRYGIIPMRDITENVTLASLEKVIFRGYRHPKLENRIVSEVCEKIRVVTPSYGSQVGNLSGGNQQKVVLAKWMLSEPEILILDEPTRGIDVGTKFEIYKIINKLAEDGKAVLFISSELPELIGVCDRILVMARGVITGELLPEEFSQENIIRLATSVVERN